MLVPFCPVQALANQVYHLFQIAPANLELPISFVGLGSHVTSNNITLAVRESVVLSGLLNLGYSPSRVSTHSLRASGAMALRLNDVGENKLPCFAGLLRLEGCRCRDKRIPSFSLHDYSDLAFKYFCLIPTMTNHYKRLAVMTMHLFLVSLNSFSPSMTRIFPTRVQDLYNL
jgi:hypothetical protein